jgi:hypothetical protein
MPHRPPPGKLRFEVKYPASAIVEQLSRLRIDVITVVHRYGEGVGSPRRNEILIRRPHADTSDHLDSKRLVLAGPYYEGTAGRVNDNSNANMLVEAAPKARTEDNRRTISA